MGGVNLVAMGDIMLNSDWWKCDQTFSVNVEQMLFNIQDLK